MRVPLSPPAPWLKIRVWASLRSGNHVEGRFIKFKDPQTVVIVVEIGLTFTEMEIAGELVPKKKTVLLMLYLL